MTSRRRISLSTTLLALLLAFANVIPASAATFGDADELGTIFPGVTSTDAERLDYVNHMIGLTPGATDTYAGQPFTRSGNDFGALPAAQLVGLINGTGTLIDVRTSGATYLYAKYDGPADSATIWYFGSLTGAITIPPLHSNYGLSDWTLFTGAALPPPDHAATGAKGTGFWQRKVGQAIIKAEAVAGVCPSGTWLRQFAPFQDLGPDATCGRVASYVASVIKAANASRASMNSMLKAQMLATALDVYFSDPALGGNRLGAPAPIGDATVDLTRLDPDASPAFGNATCVSVLGLLTYAGGQSTAGDGAWYENVKPTQELAKDTFEAVNGQQAFAC
jgi:hypothetical protein